MNRPAAPSTVISVDLGDLAAHARDRVAAGDYKSLDSLLRAALLALSSVESDFSDEELDDIAERAAVEFDASDGTTYTEQEVFDPILARLRRQAAGHAD